jgi:NAD-dependent dihydropyrimidine dehydrogenase PreA subunit
MLVCEFCTQHGEGQKWYLAMRNYSRELWEQQGREEFADHFVARFEEHYGKAAMKLDTLVHKPVVGHLVRRLATRQQKAEHWGQIVPIEDVEQIVDLQDSIVRLSCACRMLTTGREARYCFGVGVDATGILGRYPDYSHSFEVLGKEEAKNILRSFDKQGFVHSIWTCKTPFIAAICNCDQDCLAYRIQVKTNSMKVMFRAEYVALVDWDLCNGCKKCLLQCQFGAIHFSNTMKRLTIEMIQCYGCGICRAVCDQGAITLKPRTGFASLSW